MRYIFILVLGLLFTSCEKYKIISQIESNPIDCKDSSVCHVVQLGRPDSNSINTEILNIIYALFESNKISSNNLYIGWYQHDNLGYSHVGCRQYINNLEILTDELIFHFDLQGHYSGLSGTIISEIKIDSIPHLCIGQVINLYLQNVKLDAFSKDEFEKISNGCLFCELGYWDLNLRGDKHEPEYALAWLIRPIDSSVPIAVIDDKKNSVVFYDNGVRF